jgi:hypothetical protein
MKKAAEEYEIALFRQLGRTDLYNQVLELPLT